MIGSVRDFLKKYRGDQSGATAVEFALVAIPFLVMIFGVMEAGRVVWTMNGIQYAVEETSRYAALNSDLTSDDFQTYAAEKLSGMAISTGPLQITSSVVTSNGISFVEIDGSYQISTLTSNFLPGDFGNLDLEVSARKPVVD